jgi:hypothetical protein
MLSKILRALSVLASTPGPTYCPRCGHPNAPGSNYCSSCGGQL